MELSKLKNLLLEAGVFITEEKAVLYGVGFSVRPADGQHFKAIGLLPGGSPRYFKKSQTGLNRLVEACKIRQRNAESNYSA